MNALLFVLKKIKKEKKYHPNNFYVFTDSTVGVVPIHKKGTFIGKIDKIGKVKVKIN